MNFNATEFEAAFGTFDQLPQSTVPEIAFSGRSNVGKSSLMNKLVNRKNLARVSSVPGKTITINFFKCQGIRLVDLPGYGYAKVSFSEKKRWAEMMEGYFSSDRNIKLVVQLADMRHPLTEDDRSMIEYLEFNGIPYIIALTKSDKLKKTERQKRVMELAQELLDFKKAVFIPCSAQNGEGIEELKKIIEDYSAR